MKLTWEIIVDDRRWTEGLGIEVIVERVALAAAQAIWDTNIVSAGFSVLFADNAKNRELNRQWRNIDKTTNVLAFPAVISPDKSSPRYLGDISIALEIVTQEAQEQEKTLEAHVCHLVLHGLLHLFGYDHETDDEAARMESFETEILKSLGIADPYA